MRYRILAETDDKGFTWYYPQERVFLFFWKYLSVFRNVNMVKKKIGYDLISEAEKRIEREIAYEKIGNPKILKREFTPYKAVRN